MLEQMTERIIMIDAHIHLSDKRFDSDRDILLSQAQEAGVKGFFSVSTRPEEWSKTMALSRKCSAIRPFIGTHPWYASHHDDVLLKRMLISSPTAGVGEIGLDSLKGEQTQESVFENQLIIAAELNRPCVIHCVKSFDMIAAILKRLKTKPSALLFHGFSGTLSQADFLSRFNAYFSFSGSVLKENKDKLRAVLAALPADRLLAETDAPDMLPPEKYRRPDRNGRNIPVNLPLIIQGISDIRGVDAPSLTSLLHENAERFLSGK